MRSFAADPTGYHILWGTNELAQNGKLADWDITFHLRYRYAVLFWYYAAKTISNRARRLSMLITSDCRAVTPGSSHNPHEEKYRALPAAVSAFYAIWHIAIKVYLS